MTPHHSLSHVAALLLTAVLFAIPTRSWSQGQPCAARVQEMTTRLAQVHIEPMPVVFAIDGLPTSRAGQALSDAGAVITIQRDFPVVFAGNSLDVDDTAASHILAQRIADHTILYVAVWPDEPASRLFRVLGDLLARPIELRLIVQRPAPRATVRTTMATINTLQAAAGSCSAIISRIGSSAGQGTGRRWIYLRDMLPNDVTSCQCRDVDVQRLTTTLTTLAASELSYRWLPLALEPSGTSGTNVVILPANARMSAAASALERLPHGHRLRFAPQ